MQDFTLRPLTFFKVRMLLCLSLYYSLRRNWKRLGNSLSCCTSSRGWTTTAGFLLSNWVTIRRPNRVLVRRLP